MSDFNEADVTDTDKPDATDIVQPTMSQVIAELAEVQRQSPYKFDQIYKDRALSLLQQCQEYNIVPPTELIDLIADYIGDGTGLTRVGGGLLPTWPSQLSFMGILIDQILNTAEFKGSKMTVGPHLNSDHLPLIAKLKVK